MAITKEDYLNSIKERLGWLCSYIRLQNGSLRFDVNRAAESFYADLLNLVYGYDLSNGNDETPNLSAIDLVDEKNRLAVQVTSDTSSGKVKETLKKFTEKSYRGQPYEEAFDRLIVLIITEKVGHKKAYRDLADAESQFGVAFDPDGDIWDVNSIIADLSSRRYSVKKLKEISAFLEENLSFVHGEAGKANASPILTPNIPIKNKLVGRIEKKEELYRHIKGFQTTALTGDGGIGKTALASDLFYRLKGEGWQVGWVQCNRRLTEEILQISVSEEMGDVEERRRQILDWLESEQENVCLFFDNVDRTLKNEERKLLGRIHPSIRVVVTTRQGSEGIGFEKDEMIAVPIMPREEARELFYRYYSHNEERGNDGVIDELISMAGGNTLLIELTSRAASVEGGTLREFAENIRNRPLQSISKAALRTAHLGKYGEDVETLTILQELLRIYSVIDMGEEEIRILRLFSIMPENTEIWYKVREWADLDINAMKKLTDLGWLRQSDFGYEIHGIIKASLQVQWVERGLSGIRLEDYGRLVDELRYSKYFDISEGYSVVRKRLALPVAVARYVWDDRTQYSRDMGYVFNNIGLTYGDLGDHRQALEYYKKGLAIRKEILPPTHPDLASSYNNIGNTYGDLGEHRQALEYKKKALAIREEVLPPTHPNLADSYNNIGVAYSDLGEHRQALEYYKKALAIREEVLPATHPDLASSYNNIGNTYGDLGEHRQALEYKKKALAIWEEVLPPTHPNLAISYYNLSITLNRLEKTEEAIDYALKAQRVWKQSLPPEHEYHSVAERLIQYLKRSLHSYSIHANTSRVAERLIQYLKRK